MGLLSILPNGRWLFALGGLLFYLVYKVRVYYRLRAFKGPPGSGWFQFWHSKAWLGYEGHARFKEVCDKYGDIARVGPNDLITCSRELLTHMSAVRSPYTRTPWFSLAVRPGPGVDHLFSEMDEDVHMRKRQQMTAGFSGKENLELEGTMDIYIEKFIHLIRSKYLSSPNLAKPFDIGEKVQYLAVDVINGVGLGESLGDLDADNDQYQYIKGTDVGIKLGVVLSSLGILPFMQSPWIGRIIGPSESDQVGFGRVLRHVRTRIEARLKQGTENRSDMLASFVRHGLTIDELVREVLLQIIAGADTTSTGIRSILLYLLTHPRVYAKLQAEVDAAVASGKAPPAPGIISDVEAKDLPYLQACIKEGMRVHPPAGGPFPKRVPDGGDTVMVDGKPVFLPGGTHISYAVWPLHLDKRVYGEDAEEFRPERWLLEKDEAKLAAMHRTHDLIFGYGKYQCLGKPVALMEINKAIFEMMRHFDVCLARPEKPWEQANLFGIFTQRDMFVHAIDRVGGAKH